MATGKASVVSSPCATVEKDTGAEPERWVWKIKGLKRPWGWRKPIGHRTTWLDARRSADAYWEKWCAAASLRPDLQRLALQSLPPEERPKARRRKSTKHWGRSRSAFSTFE